MPKVFVSWSGGKDSCLAGYLASKNNARVEYLVNMITGDGKRSWTHGLTTRLLKLQARALGIPLVQRRTTGTSYQTEFTGMLLTLKERGITGGVFGDIDLVEHRNWVERVCEQAGITPYLPLWGQPQGSVLRTFIDAGFEAVIVAARADLFDETILGQTIDRNLIRRLEKMSRTGNFSPCGESGEYHTLVIDGPWFQHRLEIGETRKIVRGEHRFLDIMNAKVRDS